VARYLVVSDESPVTIDASSSMHPVRATSTALAGTVEFELGDHGRPDLDRPYRAELRLALTSIRSGNRLQDREMHRRLDSRHHPEIAVEATEVTRSGGDQHYRAIARLTVRGFTREVDADIRLAIDGDRVVIEGERVIDMRWFGIQPPRLVLLKVQPEVVVRVRITARRQGLSQPGGTAPSRPPA
jgi:polyisoprenoid-binding protein YceI